MVELELVGLSEDGTRLVLADAAGDEFTVPLDERLRGLVRRDRARTGQWETSMESALRPRDIQARIRAGESPDAVAEIAQVPVDRIMGYAVPVMAERQHIAERAQRSSVRRKNAEGPGQQLWDAVAARLRDSNVDPMTCQWDAWRRDDGRWIVTARFRGTDGERTGRFVFDALSRYTIPDDDDARWLVGERTTERNPRAPRRTTGRRLSAVSSEYDAMLFDDDEPTTELTAVADVLRSADDPRPPLEADRQHHDGEDRRATSRHQRSQDEAPEADGPDGPAEDAVPGQVEIEVEQEASRTASGEQQQTKQQPKPEKRGRKGRGRASVPSWDEIMFGQPKG